jgi:hypothetical protein
MLKVMIGSVKTVRRKMHLLLKYVGIVSMTIYNQAVEAR